MADFIIYTIPICPYCAGAKNLLKQKGFSFEEKTIDKENGVGLEDLEEFRKKQIMQKHYLKFLILEVKKKCTLVII